MFPTRCRTEVRRLYIVHSEISETTLFQGQPNTKISLHGNNECHTKHDFSILIHILCPHTLTDSCQKIYMAVEQRFSKAFRLPKFNPSMTLGT